MAILIKITNPLTCNHIAFLKKPVIKSIILLIFSMNCFLPFALAEEKILITINQFMSHPALDSASQGIQYALKNRGILPDIAQIMISNAQGNISNSAQISKHQASLLPKFMVAIATPSAQTALKARKGQSILSFVAVTDPEAANLIGKDNVIGVSDNPPIEDLLNIVNEIFPEIKNIGAIYNSGEVNSAKIIKTLAISAEKRGIKLHLASINNSNDIKLAMQKLLGKVDIIYLPLDNSVVSGISNIVALSKESKIPLICNDPVLVENGVTLALGANYLNSGLQLGNMMADIIEGKKLDQPIQESKSVELKINQEMVKYFNITIPENLLNGK